MITIFNYCIAGALSESAKAISSTYLRRYNPISSPLFTGRRDILDILESYFEARGTGRHHRREFLLHGLGGAGKTQLMLKFAEINQSRYEKIHGTSSLS